MKIELNGLELDYEGENGEGRSVTNISTVESRNTAAYDGPGSQSSAFSDLGRGAIKVVLEGVVSEKDGATLLEGIWSCFKKGEPVEFYSDITGAADITKVLIESMVVKSFAGNRNRYDYNLELLEYREPPEEPEAPTAGEGAAGEEEEGEEGEEGKAAAGSQADAEALEWAEEVAEDSAAGSDLTGTVVDEAGKPAKSKKVTISGQGREMEVQTDDNGKYQVPDLAPGVYKVTADDSETQYVNVGSGSKSEEEDEADLKAIEAELDEIESLVMALEIDAQTFKALSDLQKAKGRGMSLMDKIGIIEAKLATIYVAAVKVNMIRKRLMSIRVHLRNIVIRAIEDKLAQLNPADIQTGLGGGDGSSTVDETVEEVEETVEEVEETVEETVEEVEETVEETVEEVEETVEEVEETVEEVVDNVEETVGDAVDTAEQAIDEFFGDDEEEE